MKLILTQEVNGLGHPGDVVTVKDGFARNFLVPNGKAIAWSTGGERVVTVVMFGTLTTPKIMLQFQPMISTFVNYSVMNILRHV